MQCKIVLSLLVIELIPAMLVMSKSVISDGCSNDALLSIGQDQLDPSSNAKLDYQMNSHQTSSTTTTHPTKRSNRLVIVNNSPRKSLRRGQLSTTTTTTTTSEIIGSEHSDNSDIKSDEYLLSIETINSLEEDKKLHDLADTLERKYSCRRSSNLSHDSPRALAKQQIVGDSDDNSSNFNGSNGNGPIGDCAKHQSIRSYQRIEQQPTSRINRHINDDKINTNSNSNSNSDNNNNSNDKRQLRANKVNKVLRLACARCTQLTSTWATFQSCCTNESDTRQWCMKFIDFSLDVVS